MNPVVALIEEHGDLLVTVPHPTQWTTRLEAMRCHIYKLPVPIVQRQVGHTTLDATMTYCRPSDEFVGESYRKARGLSKAGKAVSGYDTEPEQQLYDIK